MSRSAKSLRSFEQQQKQLLAQHFGNQRVHRAQATLRKRQPRIVTSEEPVNFAVQSKEPRFVNVNLGSPTVSKDKRPDLDSAAGISAGLLGTAALVAPAVAPVAVAAGLGYGTYKLGQSLKLW